MYLKILENKPLLKTLLGPKSPDLKLLLEDYLVKFLQKKDHNLFYAKDLNPQYLNTWLFNIRDHFAEDIGSAPLPLSILISEDEDSTLPKDLNLPGKIYVQGKAKNTIEKSLSQIELFHKINPLRDDFFQLVLPATVEPKLIFPFKEIYFVPKDEPCFFCGTYCHESIHCPGLKVMDPLTVFQKYLEVKLEDISAQLRREYENTDQEDKYSDGFWCRHFYLFPSFLKFPFYFSKELNFWSSLYEPLSFPVKGGDLFIALEHLLRGNIGQAEASFIKFEGDLLAELGLTMTNILKQNFTKSLYHLENALSVSSTPFLKSYIYSLKGYIYHYLRETLIAEDNYREALKTDSSCLPAYYFLNLLNYERGEPWQKIFPYFQNPYVIYLAFLEPKFIKHQKELEETLEKAFDAYRAEAQTRLKEVEDKFHSLVEILTQEEKNEYEEKIKKIRDSVYNGGLMLIERASKVALELALELNGYVFSSIKKLKSYRDSYFNRYLALSKFWQKYPFKEEEATFGSNLSKAYRLLELTDKRMKKSDVAKELKMLKKDIHDLNLILETLEGSKIELIKKWRFRSKLRRFILRFAIAEGSLLTIFGISTFWPKADIFESIFTFGNFLIFSFAAFVLILITVLLEKDESEFSLR
ncbi:MAG: hypothetical protein N2Z40_06910 [Caldimicrobium sp.]|nr:hypothetical protein [Caldimicrobium sp.]MCX7613931.1 hypothetical protein [Caldimicrobium sp.]MDW8182014.1 hypothetical protein [Caldimicrobium sp.]